MQNQEIKVSVLCLCYNHGKYLTECLDSLVCQKTNFSYEIIIHDDASTDNSQDIIREYSKKYPEIIKPILQVENQSSQGKSVLSYVWKASSGKYIAFCECDDFWCDENKLQMQYDVMEANPTLAMCVHKTENINEDGTSQKTFFPEEVVTEGIISKNIILNRFPFYWFHTSSYFMKKEIKDHIETDLVYLKKSCPVGDVLKLYIAAVFGDFYYIDSVMSKYRRNSNGSWSNRMRDNSEYRIRHDERMLEFIEKFDVFLNEQLGKNHQFKNRIEYATGYYNFRILLCKKNYKKAVFSKKYRTIFKKLDKREQLGIIAKVIIPIKK